MYRYIFACFMVALFIPADPGLAQDDSQSMGPPPWAILGRPSAAPLSVPQYNRLHATLLERGAVRVIVRLRQSDPLQRAFAPESHLLNETEIQAQRNALRRQQENLAFRLSPAGAARVRRYQFIPFMALEVDNSDFNALLNSPEIDFVQEDMAIPPVLAQSVPLIGAAIDGTFSGFSGFGMAVAILDTGVDSTHPFLAGKVIEEACYSTTSPGNSESLCPNGQDVQVGPGAGANCDASVAGCYHGTHVAGIAAGKGGAFNGVARDASVIAIQLFSKFSGSSYCGSPTAVCALSWTSDQILALERVYALKDTYAIASVNMSLGGGSYTSNCDSALPAQKAAIDNLRSAGIATVIASGNGGMSNAISQPGCVSSAVSVGATTKSDAVASYSNSASFLSLLAPGSSITSSLPGNAYGSLSGTSMATPHVTGAWAVARSKKPDATVDEILTAMRNSGVPITDTRNGLVKPRIQVDRALSQISSQTNVILFRNSDGRLAVWNMSGAVLSGSYTLNNGNPISTSWRLAGTADFDRDGHADYLWQNTDGRLSLWYMNGAALSRSVLLNNGSPVNKVWTVTGIGDFNLDGSPDILWRHSDGRLLVWYMSGASLLSSSLLNGGNPVNLAWRVSGIGDFNRDGKADILWQNADGRLQVWYMNGASLVSNTALNGGNRVNTAWRVVGASDFSGYGGADILWQNADGRLLVWHMNYAALSGSTFLNGGIAPASAWSAVGIHGP